MKILLYFFSILSLHKSYSQSAKLTEFSKIQNIYKSRNDTTYIVNFFTTWCTACKKQILLLDELSTKNLPIKVMFVSLDIPKDSFIVRSYVNNFKLQSKSYLMNDLNYDSWMPKIESKWSGSVPFTIMYRGITSEKYWIEGKLNKDDLRKKLKEIYGYEIP